VPDAAFIVLTSRLFLGLLWEKDGTGILFTKIAADTRESDLIRVAIVPINYILVVGSERNGAWRRLLRCWQQLLRVGNFLAKKFRHLFFFLNRLFYCFDGYHLLCYIFLNILFDFLHYLLFNIPFLGFSLANVTLDFSLQFHDRFIYILPCFFVLIQSDIVGLDCCWRNLAPYNLYVLLLLLLLFFKSRQTVLFVTYLLPLQGICWNVCRGGNLESLRLGVFWNIFVVKTITLTIEKLTVDAFLDIGYRQSTMQLFFSWLFQTLIWTLLLSISFNNLRNETVVIDLAVLLTSLIVHLV